MKILVKGHSGCQIDIVNEDDKLYISKSTDDPSYVNRLYLQAKKQLEAVKNEYQHIRVPEIYEINKTVSNLTIKMEYVYSKNFVDYFEDAGFDNINYFVKALKIFIDSEIEKSTIKEINTSIIHLKFEDVYKKCKANICINSDNQINQILGLSSDLFNTLPRFITLPIGECHGDLTFSNILFNGNNYYLIDFLDSFIESPLIDIVKIRQDSSYGWSQLMYNQSYDVVRMRIICEKIDKEIEDYYKRFSWFSEYYKVFQLMNMLRVLQYAREDKTIVFLKHIINSLLYEY